MPGYNQNNEFNTQTPLESRCEHLFEKYEQRLWERIALVEIERVKAAQDKLTFYSPQDKVLHVINWMTWRGRYLTEAEMIELSDVAFEILDTKKHTPAYSLNYAHEIHKRLLDLISKEE